MNKLSNRINSLLVIYERYAPFLLGAALVLIRLPPVRLLPIGEQIQTHNLFRLIMLMMFVLLLIIKRGRIFQGNHAVQYLLVILFFVAESLSVVGASNISTFMLVYKDVLFSLLVFIVTANTVRKKHVVILMYAVVIATAINMIFQLITYFAPTFTINLLQPFLYSRYWQFFSYQIGRDRYFGDSFDEIFIPLLVFFYFYSGNKVNKILALLLTSAITFITVVSNWRTKAIVFAVVSICTMFLYIKKVKIVSLYVIIGVVVLFLANSISLSTIGFNVYDRFILSDAGEIQTVGGRISYWKEAAELGLAHPFTGVGLGNYYDNLGQRSKMNNQAGLLDHTILVDDPHNVFMSIFATTGLTGLVLFILILTYFVIRDMGNFQAPQRIFIIMFWGLLVFALFNPFQYASYLYLFWFLRGTVTGLTIHDENN